MKKDIPKVSAIITTHNRLELLKRAVESVRNQTYPNIELIVVDDASTDGTEQWCMEQDFHFIHIPKEESRGGNHARNLGVMAAEGEYVAFLDDDDYWLPEKTIKQVRLIEQMDCELVHCLRRVEQVLPDGSAEYSDQKPNPHHWGDMSRKVLCRILTTTSLIMVKRQALFDVGLFDENLRFWQEYELTIRLAQRKPFYYVPEPLCVYRVDHNDKGRLTNKYSEWKKSVRYVREKHKKLYSTLGPLERIYCLLTLQVDGMKRALSAAGLKGGHHVSLITNWFFKYPFRCMRCIKQHLIYKSHTLPPEAEG